MKWVGLIFILFLQNHLVLGAKHYLFKTCEQSGFCKRNIHYAHNIEENYYTIDSFNIDETKAYISGNLIKSIPQGEISLNWQLGIVNGGFRFTVDEERHVKGIVNSKRFSPANEFNIEYVSRDQVSIEKSDILHISYNSTVIKVYPKFKIEVYDDKKLTMQINDDNLLNFEHYRLNNEGQMNTPESDFNMFQDDFKDSRDDKLPLGPESIALDFKFKGYQHLYGLPEHSDSLELGDKLYRLFNVDIFEYEINSTLPMYGSIPFLLAMNEQSSMGLFWINAADTYVDVKHSNQDTSTHWISENGVMDFIVFTKDSNRDIQKKYGDITGFTVLPPLFSLGYHQCRWNYNDEADVLDITEKFDEYEIPYDTIWLDIEYTDNKKYFTWNENFPNPTRMLQALDHTGRNLVVIIDPHIKKDYDVSNYLVENKLTIMNSQNSTYYGHCWPGESVWVDSLNPKVQQYWDSLHTSSGFMGNSSNVHIWNDMNEISVFDGPETSSPKDNLHYGGWEDRSVHNINGMKFHEITYDSLIKRQQETTRQRPFILTRSYFSGSQKTAAMWTGDNMSKWEYLKISIPMVLNNGLAGMPFAGADVGGFFGDPSKELLTRWYQTGIFYPFFRAHAHIDSRRREPWIPGDPFTSYIRDAIKLRYALLPVFYTSFYESSINGAPVLKPIFYDTGKHFDIEDEFYIGNSGILVKPVTEPDVKEQKIILPESGKYYNFVNGIPSTVTYKGDETISIPVTLNDIPMFVKGGHIIFTQPRYRRSSKLMVNDPYTITVFLDENNKADGDLYADDGESFNYQNGQFLKVHVEANESRINFVVENSWNAKYINKVIVVGKDIKTFNVKISLNGNYTFKFENQHIHELIHDEL
ncbi:glucosidase 2 subunit alpha [[Candida] jaroonii]|uniref:Glucosidase 2 subunit alpha n=1 Tax=[Candida] jaroonii TaxID=467808 RepID=A0ACA9YBW8_9ASCO|nr:glucosidase 2 subunit alpha [[Candida] jaroonii]